MADLEIVLRYGGHEVQAAVPLSVDLPEALRRVRLKKGPCPFTELSYQLVHDIEDSFGRDRPLQKLAADLVEKAAKSGALG